MAEEGTKNGWNISLVNQPPNSPDMNILDLGFFNAIQALQMTENTATVDELIAAVQHAFDELDVTTLNNSFLTLQNVVESCLKDHGGNHYPLPHMHKQKLAREGRLPEGQGSAKEGL